jgi:hypothetical protein
MSSEQARCQGGQAKGKEQTPVPSLSLFLSMAEKRVRKKQRPDCARQLVHHHDFQDKNVKRCQLPNQENCCLFTFLPSFYPSLFFPTNPAFEAVWQFEGNRRVSGRVRFQTFVRSYPFAPPSHKRSRHSLTVILGPRRKVQGDIVQQKSSFSHHRCVRKGFAHGKRNTHR